MEVNYGSSSHELNGVCQVLNQQMCFVNLKMTDILFLAL